VRVAVISDVHGNLQALEAVVEHADREEVEELWCLGDVVGYGGRPSECLELVTERAAICLGGNHDLVVAGVLDIDQFTSDAGIAARWTRSVLSPDELERLALLSPVGERAGVSLFHGSIRDPIWEYVLTADVADASLRAQTTDLALVGHSHVQLALALAEGALEGGKAEPDQEVPLNGGAKRLLNPGSTGQPRDRDPRAAWLLLDTEAGLARFMRSEYRIERAQADIRAAGLPTRLADRLERGL
jgi:predicted phosphodiesterase